MARIKWIKNDVSLERGNYLAVVVKFDNSKVWLRPAAMMTARNVKFWAESLAKEHNSSTVELKYFKDCTDGKIITYYLYYDETEGELVEGYRTEIEVEDGEYPDQLGNEFAQYGTGYGRDRSFSSIIIPMN